MKLTFRQRGLSKAIKRRLLLLISVFFISLVLFIFLLNMNRDVFLSDKVESASLPTLSVVSKEETYGAFFGYKSPLDLGRVRNGLVPLGKERNIEVLVNTYGNTISDISYELNTGDGNRRISGGMITGTAAGNVISAPLSLSNLTEEGKEYMLTLRLNEENPIYYYMRVKYVEKGFEKECLDFARYFCKTALSDNYSELATYMEPKNVGRKNLSKVTINSSLNDVGWKGFEISEYSEPVATFAEIDKNYTALTLNYILVGSGETSGRYIVKEYYRMRHGEERIFLLDFERNIEQVFDSNMAYISEGDLILGQKGGDVEFLSNRTGTGIAFAWNGELFEYNASNSQISKVFSFGKIDYEDERTLHDEYRIKILKIDENGNIDFTVYGYMNSGAHEGYCGIGLYHYDYLEDHTTEQAFVLTDHSFTSLNAGFDGGIFLSSTGTLYVSVEGELMRSYLSDNESTVIIKSKEGITYSLSEEGRYLGYTEMDGNKLVITDLFSEKTNEIPAEPGKKFRIMGFMGEDLIYGVINDEDYTETNRANNIYPMSEVRIVGITSEGGQLLKSYSNPGLYVMDMVKESSYNIRLALSEKIADYFVEKEKDSIQNTGALGNSRANIGVLEEDRISKVKVEFVTPGSKEQKSLNYRDFDKINLSNYTGEAVWFKVDTDSVYYYAFRGLDVKRSSDFPGTAIKEAYKSAGYCVDNDGNYIWQYGRGSQRNTLDQSALEKEGKRKINLTGCDLEEVLSYVYRGYPVFFGEEGSDPIAIMGFDSSNITIMYINRETEETERLPLKEATTLFSDLGKRFVCYISE